MEIKRDRRRKEIGGEIEGEGRSKEKGAARVRVCARRRGNEK